MRNLLKISGLLTGLVLMLSACPAEQSDRTTDPNDVDTTRQETTTTNRMQTKLDADSAAFLGQAQQGSMTEIELGQLALAKSANAEIQTFANQLIEDHSKASQEVGDLAVVKHAVLPNAITAEQQSTYNRLQNLSGATFDKEFIQANLKAHKDTIAAFQRQASGSPDMDVRTLANKTLPTLHMHLQMATDIAANMK